MKALGEFILFIIIALLVGMILAGITSSQDGVNIKFKIGDNVLILPDSTKGIIYDEVILTGNAKVNGVKIREIVAEFYFVQYKDNNGVIQKLNWVNPEILIKIK